MDRGPIPWRLQPRRVLGCTFKKFAAANVANRNRRHGRDGERSQRGIAEMRSVNRPGLTMQMLEKAETEREKQAADSFAWWVLASEPETQ